MNLHLLIWLPNVLASFVEKAILFPELSLYLCQKISFTHTHTHIQHTHRVRSMFELFLLFYWRISIVSLSILTPILNYFDHCSLTICLQVNEYKSPTLFLLVKVIFPF